MNSAHSTGDTHDNHPTFYGAPHRSQKPPRLGSSKLRGDVRRDAFFLTTEGKNTLNAQSLNKLPLNKQIQFALRDARRTGDPVFFGIAIKALIKQKDYDGALEAVEEKLAIDPRNVIGFGLKAQALIGKGDYDGALEAVEELHAIDPRNVIGYMLMIRILVCQRKHTELHAKMNSLIQKPLPENCQKILIQVLCKVNESWTKNMLNLIGLTQLNLIDFINTEKSKRPEEIEVDIPSYGASIWNSVYKPIPINQNALDVMINTPHT